MTFSFLLLKLTILLESGYGNFICGLIISVNFPCILVTYVVTVYVTYLLLKTLDSQTCTWMEDSFDPALAEELLKKECILQGILY